VRYSCSLPFVAEWSGMTRAAVGHSLLLETETAARQAWSSVTEAIGVIPQCAIVFATSGYDHAQIARVLRAEAPSLVLVGCSAEGIVTQGRSDEVDHALGIVGIHSDRLCFDGFVVSGYAADSAQAGAELARAVSASGRTEPLALIVFPDGLSGDCTRFLDALSQGLPPGMPIVGGAAADALRMDSTQQLCGTDVVSGGVAALLVSGRGRAAIAVGHGCRPIGRTRMVSAMDGGWLVSLDGTPAWQWFRQYLDGDAQDLRADGIMHLSVGLISEDDPEGSTVVRTPMLLRHEDGALFFPGGGIAVGSRVRLVRRDPVSMRVSAAQTAQSLVGGADAERPDLVLQFDCSGRGKLLFGSCAADEIVAPVQDIVGRDVPWLGFHTYGEIAPLGGRARYHNYTVALLALYPPR
jgi:hypothetical protein